MPLHSEDVDLAQLWNQINGVAGAPAVSLSAATVSGATTFTGAASFGSTVAVTGATTLSSTLGVTGAATLAAATLSGTATFNGAATFNAAATLASTSTISGVATFNATPLLTTGLDLRGSLVNGAQVSAGTGLNLALATVGTVTAETIGLQQAAQQLTITGGYTTQRFAVFAAPTISAATSLTVTNAATVAIAGAPVAAGAGPAVITNPYSLWVQGGSARFDGTIQFPGGAASLTNTSGTNCVQIQTGSPFLYAPNGFLATPPSTSLPCITADAGGVMSVPFLRVTSNVLTATSANSGANGAAPALVAGYLPITIGATTFKIPYFAN